MMSLPGGMQVIGYAFELLQRDSRAHLAPVVGLGIDGGCLIPVLLGVELAILWWGRILPMDRCRAPFFGIRILWPAEHRSWQEEKQTEHSCLALVSCGLLSTACSRDGNILCVALGLSLIMEKYAACNCKVKGKLWPTCCRTGENHALH